ncbi:pentapeptide repeat-containing protein [Kalymmatonema gypsitolerans NIES-4073]|nr:pentapeptide repeat-containing protein [Scytonema sp. NIES-4073]
MSNETGIRVTKPDQTKRWQFDVNNKELIKSSLKLGGSIIAKSDSFFDNLVDVGASIGLAKKPGELAWLLVVHSLTQAIDSLLKDYRKIYTQVITDTISVFSQGCLDRFLIDKELTIYPSFFDNPIESLILQSNKTPLDIGKTTYFFEEVKTLFTDWLRSFNVNDTPLEIISSRLRTKFVYALAQELKENSDKYTRLEKELNVPFLQSTEQERKKELAWHLYSVWLEDQVEQRIFDEFFTLKDVYVPLRAYYKREIKGKNDDDAERQITKDKRYEQIVVELESELEAWLNTADPKDAIRVISGGPGSGKSSFTKWFAAKLVKKEKEERKHNVQVLFIPLHFFDLKGDLVDEVSNFIESTHRIPLPPNPLKRDNSVSRLLIIFDGLDELSMRGKIDKDIAQEFVSVVQRQVEKFNDSDNCKLQVLISGRELVVQQAHSSVLRQIHQTMHILPYFVSENQRDNYIDEQELLNEDQRNFWWQNYGKAIGQDFDGLPSDLESDDFIEITSQPLQSYLVASVFVEGKLESEQSSNLSYIYGQLLQGVYQRGWADNKQHAAVKEFDIQNDKDFARILEEIAIACWHGDGRTTTVKKIEKKYASTPQLKKLFEEYKQVAEKGVTRLLTAFYFRQGEVKDDENTFEFTHKTFGEYLTARRIVREVDRLEKMQERSKNDFYEHWNDKEALKAWANLCGSTAMDEYIFKFVLGEMQLKDKAEVGKWQQTLCHLISIMLRDGMPMEELKLDNFKEQNRQARNAEEALLAVLNACARVTEEISHIKWHDSVKQTSGGEEKKYFKDFGVWISRLHGQRVDENEVFCLNCLSFLDLQNCILFFKEFYKADLSGADLSQAFLTLAFLGEADLSGADLSRADLSRADLSEADLREADLREADLSRADLSRADLRGAVLRGADLSGAVLRGAVLRGADLSGAVLKKTKREGANFAGTILEGKDLTYLDEDDDDDDLDFEGEDLTLDEDEQDSHSDES